MTEQERWWFRLGLLSELVSRASTKLGRTGIMKLAYLLQTVKGLPLGYDFRLYTYGPFESDVLNDLGSVEALGAVKSEMVTFASGTGYGYEFTPGKAGDFVREMTKGALSDYEPDIHWALEEFGGRSAGELELLTTIIYADREAAQRGEQLTVRELAREVGEVKPRFTEAQIIEKIEELCRKRLLIALSPAEEG